MKLIIKLSLTLTLLAGFTFTTQAQKLGHPRIGVGLQTIFPFGGLSVKADLTEQHSAQAVIGVFGPISSYYGRYAYNFKEDGKDFKIKPYLFAQAGVFAVDYTTFDANFQLVEAKEKSPGFGAGAGLEWHYKPFSEKLRFNVEVGYWKVDLSYYELKAIMYGGGIHYYFEL